MTPAALARLLKTPTGHKLIRYSMVSAVGIVLTQAFIIVLHAGMGIADVPTNIIAVAVSSVPAYYLNRAWVWGKRGKSHLTKEVLPFWLFAFAGLVLSTVLVAWLEPSYGPGEKATFWDTVRVMGGNIAGFGILWVARYVVLDRLLFGEHHHTPFGDEIDAELSHLEVDGSAR